MTGLVGRDYEITRLTGLLGEVENGTPAFVVVSGDAGVGKSRLVGEFCDRARASGAVVLSGGCLELDGGVIPYGPLVEALRLLVRQRGETEAEQLAGPAWNELGALIADFTDAEPTASMMGAQTRVFGAVSRLLDHIGAQAPLVLVFEDVQWADTATLDLLAYLALTSSDQRMMLLCSHRSKLPAGHPLRTRLAKPELTRKAHKIGLEPFTAWESRVFVAALSDSQVSPEQADHFFELAEGNPYFTEQLLAAGGDSQVPESLSDLMLARLMRLGDNAMSVVRVAAVAGRRVSDELLARIAGLEDAVLDAALTECLDNGILVEERVDDSYRFQHALLRETAYNTVRSRERRRLHAALAEALTEEVAYNPYVLSELAYHWSAADRTPEALRASVVAGDLAMRVRAFQDAEAQYARALDLWSRHLDAEVAARVSKVQILTAAADAARWAGHLGPAVAWMEEAVAHSPLDGVLHERLGNYRWEAGFDAQSLAAYQEAHRLLSTGPASASGSRARSALATAQVKIGNYTEALAMARRAEQEAHDAGAAAEVGRALNSSGLARVLLGEHDEGLAELRQAKQIAEETDHLEDMLRASANLGVCLERAGQVAEAVEIFRAALDRSRELGVLGSRHAGLLANNACATLFLTGGWDEADQLIREVLRYHPARETTFQRLTKAEMDIATGRFAEAGHLLESIRNHPSSQPKFLSPLYRCLAELAARQGNAAAAMETVRRGIEAIAGREDDLLVLQLCACGLGIAADTSDVPDLPMIVEDLLARAASAGAEDDESSVLAAWCAAEGDRYKGVDTPATWHAVAQGWRALARPYPMAQALARLAASAVRAGEKDLAAQASAEAADIAEQLGAAPLATEIVKLRRTHRLQPRTAPSERHAFRLTERELDVLRWLCEGLTNNEIANRLYITKNTVGTHLHNAYRKLGVDNKYQAIAKVRALGLFDD